jgi:hypothetical protein
VRWGGLWAKHIGLKQGAIGNNHGEHIGNKGNIKQVFFGKKTGKNIGKK